MNIRAISIIALLVAHAATYAHSAFLNQWQARVAQIRSKHPGWNVRHIAQYPSLIQVVQTDFVMQVTGAHTATCQPTESVA
jgi:hypothetical protein